jgi:predicted Zn finger-like uncharacterized protein
VKFLCEHCKAKYQIADEKVAGRTVRMKCRKCGNSIEVRAAVTETSVNAKLPTDPPPAGHAAPAAPAAPGKHDPLGAPRPGRSLATSLSSAPKPAPTRPSAARSTEGGNLAGAFHRNVQREEEISVALDLRELSAADEWYVAINGVPVGPIRVAELRRKAAIGVVNEESLCWQEGMEEWRPVRAVAELAALVREAAAGGRVSLVTPPPPESRPSVAGPPPRPSSTRPPGSPIGPRPPRPGAFSSPQGAPPGYSHSSGGAPLAPVATTARSNVVPFTSRLATAEKLQEDPFRSERGETDAVAMIAADPFATPAAPSSFQPAPSPFGAPSPPPAGAPPVDPLGSSLPASAPAGPLVAAGVPEKKPPPFTAIAMIVLAGAFGITAAIVLVKPAPQVVVQVPSAAAPPPQVAPPVAPPPPVATPNPNDNPTAATSPDGGAAKVASATRPGTGSSKQGGTTSATDPGIRDLIGGLGNGPTPGPGDPSAGGGGAQLTADQVQAVLAQHQLAVKRNCWERIQTQSSSVNEMVAIVVGPSGQVSSATATGNDGVVGHCIEGEVKRWSFPGSGTINIPFHFLRQ